MNEVEEKRSVESWVAFHAPLKEGYLVGVYCCLYSKATAVHFYSPAISLDIVCFCFTTSVRKSIGKQVECEKPHIIGGVSYKRPSCWNPVYWTRNLLCYAGVPKRSFFVEGSCLVREVKVLRSTPLRKVDYRLVKLLIRPRIASNLQRNHQRGSLIAKKGCAHWAHSCTAGKAGWVYQEEGKGRGLR